jgi:hypothetical protein
MTACVASLGFVRLFSSTMLTLFLLPVGVLQPGSGAWAYFMREIIKLPREMTPAISQVIRPVCPLFEQ